MYKLTPHTHKSNTFTHTPPSLSRFLCAVFAPVSLPVSIVRSRLIALGRSGETTESCRGVRCAVGGSSGRVRYRRDVFMGVGERRRERMKEEEEGDNHQTRRMQLNNFLVKNGRSSPRGAGPSVQASFATRGRCTSHGEACTGPRVLLRLASVLISAGALAHVRTE